MNGPIVITGMGVICPLGIGMEAVWQRVVAGESGIVRGNGVWGKSLNGLPVALARPYEASASRASDFAWQAAQEALGMARLIDAQNRLLANPMRVGIAAGSSKGNISALGDFLRVHSGQTQAMPWQDFFHHGPAEAIRQKTGIAGPCLSLISACSTGAHNIVQGARWILDGDADMVLAGATESSFTPLVLAGFKSMGVLATADAHERPETVARPYDKKRRGFVIGEGAGMVVLERRSHALGRGAKIFAELIGWGLAADAYKPVGMDPRGLSLEAAMRHCLRKAGLVMEDVDYVNCHGTGTLENDRIESRALKRMMAGAKRQAALSSTKPMTGHLLGAAGSVEFLLTLQALLHDHVPATLNLDTPDPECGDLDFTPRKGRAKKITHAMSLSYGFGGHVSALAIRKAEAACNS